MTSRPESARRFHSQIVLASVHDGRGNRKNRPVAIVARDDEIAAGSLLTVVCVSPQVERPIPTHHVALPWQRPRHPRTGLNMPNVAKCDWLVEIREDDIVQDLGFVPSAQMARIDQILRERLD